MMLFAGSAERGYFVEETGSECRYVQPSAHIQNQINEILENGPYEYMIFDVEQYIDTGKILAEEIIHIRNANGAKIVIFAPGYSVNSDVVVEMLKKDILYFIFSGNLYEQKEELKKCMNGYYDANGIAQMQSVVIERQEKLQKQGSPGKFIGIAGACSRIGTTTQCIQFVKYLLLNGYRACYVQINDNRYVEKMAEWYETEEDAEIGRVTYQFVDHFYLIDKISEVLKLEYDYYVYDFGVFTDQAFNKTLFLEKDIRIFVVGAAPKEMDSTYEIIKNSYYNEVLYIFSFTSEGDQAEVRQMMEDKANHIYFAPYAPDAYVLGNKQMQEEILPLEGKEDSEKRKKEFLNWGSLKGKMAWRKNLKRG